MVVDVMMKFEPCEYTRKMIFRSVTQSCQPLNEKLSFLRWYLFTLIFTSSVLFSRLKKANRLQRIYLVIYKLFVGVIIVIFIISISIISITICEFGVLYGTFCLIKCYIFYLDTACENKSDQRKIPMKY